MRRSSHRTCPEMMRRIKMDTPRQARAFGIALALCALGTCAIRPEFGEDKGESVVSPFWFSIGSLPAVSTEPVAPPVDPAAAPVEALFREKLASIGDSELQELSRLFLHLCRQYGFRPAMILGLIEVESAFRPAVESFAGAIGLMQVLPSTAEPIARELGLGWKGKETLADPKANLRIGFHYLSYLIIFLNFKKIL